MRLFTKKHYVVLARLVGTGLAPNEGTRFALELAQYLYEDSPRFDKARFFKAAWQARHASEVK